LIYRVGNKKKTGDEVGGEVMVFLFFILKGFGKERW